MQIVKKIVIIQKNVKENNNEIKRLNIKIDDIYNNKRKNENVIHIINNKKMIKQKMKKILKRKQAIKQKNN